MGFFKKIFKGVKKVFKKIGRGIKKVAGKIGKFMNKIGIVGQIAMAFILPGIGAALMNGLGGVATSMIANTFGGIGGAIVKGAGHVLNAAHKFVTVGKNVFNTVSQGVTKFVGEFGKTALNKIPGINIQSASQNFFGTGGAWQTVQQDIVKNASSIMNPFKSSIKITDGMSIDDLASSTGTSIERIQSMNSGVDLNNLKPGTSLNFDAGSMGNALSGQGPLSLENMRLNTPTDAFVGPPTAQTSDFWDAVARKQEMNAATQPILDTFTSILSPPKPFQVVPDAPTVPPRTLGQTMYQGAKDELAQRYPAATPFASTFRAIGDAQAIENQFSGPDYSDSGYPSAPMYVASSAQDYDVRAPSAPRNFNAYSGGGQFGSTARVYDSILMSPVSTWSRDLASRYAA
jgi:hypothetical protein